MKAKSWKQIKTEYLELVYGRYVPEFSQYSDDRDVYVHTYYSVMRAIDSLPDNPDIYVRVAMNRAIEQDTEMFDRIIESVKGAEAL